MVSCTPPTPGTIAATTTSSWPRSRSGRPIACSTSGAVRGTSPPRSLRSSLKVMSSGSSRSRRSSKRPGTGAGEPVVRAVAGTATRARRSQAKRPFDVVMSRSVLHWIPWHDHRTILEQSREVLRPGGMLRIECGGGDNVREIVAFLDDVAASIAGSRAVRAPWTFLHAGAYLDLLLDVGFEISDGFVRTVAQRRSFDRDSVLGWLHSQAAQAYEGGLDPDERCSPTRRCRRTRRRAAPSGRDLRPHVCAPRPPRARESATAPMTTPTAPTMRAMMPSVLFVSFFTTVAVTAGALDADASLPCSKVESSAATNWSTGAGCSGSA